LMRTGQVLILINIEGDQGQSRQPLSFLMRTGQVLKWKKDL